MHMHATFMMMSDITVHLPDNSYRNQVGVGIRNTLILVMFLPLVDLLTKGKNNLVNGYIYMLPYSDVVMRYIAVWYTTTT